MWIPVHFWLDPFLAKLDCQPCSWQGTLNKVIMDSHDVIPQTEYKQTAGHFSKCHTEKNRHFLRKLCYYNLIWNIFKGTLLLSKSPAAPTMKPKHGLDTSVAFAPQHWAPAILTHLGFFFYSSQHHWRAQYYRSNSSILLWTERLNNMNSRGGLREEKKIF